MKNKLKLALEFLKIIEDSGFKAYIVGGFVRDYLLNIETNDIDITTNATPKDIKNIFNIVKIKKSEYDENNYGSVIVNYKNFEFEVTTFRSDGKYLDNRHPNGILYIDDLNEDLKRRDFTINAICIDKMGHIVDPLNSKKDLQKKVIKTIKNSKKSFTEDALRILRAIRFATTLKFKLDEEVKDAIIKTKKNLKNISYERKKIELDKIFASRDAKYGIELIKELGLDKELELDNLNRIKDYTDLIGIWSMINPLNYRFTKLEKELIKNVNIVYEENNLDPLILYKYGLYVNVLAGINKGINKKKITAKYNKLPIKSKSDIDISANEICDLFNKEPDSFINTIYNSLEKEILINKLPNKKNKIIKFIQKTYLN